MRHDHESEEYESAVHFGMSGGVQTAAFDRVAEDFADAVGSAIAGVETAVSGARVTRVERDHNSR